MSEETTNGQELATTEKRLPAIDNGKPTIFNPAVMEQVWRASKLFASSDMVPKDYRDKPANCFIAIEMAERMGVNPFAVMQNLSIINGKPGMEAKLIIALVNDSGIFVDPLEYEIVGEDPYAMDYKVRCFAVMKKTGKTCLGPWIDYKMVKGEGWLQKGGSKWQTMPSIMFMYRAASFFAKVYAPNITMGMQTREEMEDITVTDVTPHGEAPPLVGAAIVQEKETVNQATREAREAFEITQQVEKTGVGTMQGTVQPGGLATGIITSETTKPARERGKPSAGHAKRTKLEMEEDRLADEKEAAWKAGAEKVQEAMTEKPEPSEETSPGCPHPEDETEWQQTGPQTEDLICLSCGQVLDTREPAPDLPDLDSGAGEQEQPSAQPSTPAQRKVLELF